MYITNQKANQLLFAELKIYEKIITQLAECHELGRFNLHLMLISFNEFKQYHDTQSLKEAWNDLRETCEEVIVSGEKYVQKLDDEGSAYLGFADFALAQVRSASLLITKIVDTIS